MTVAYPFDLRTIIRSSKSRSQPAAFRISQPRRGYSYVEASGTDTPVFWDVAFRFTREEAERFRLWFIFTVARGTLPFTIPIRTEFGSITYTVQFLPESLLPLKEIGEVFEYTAQIMARAEIVPGEYLVVLDATIADQSLTTGVAFSLDVSGNFSGGTGPYAFSVASGTLPTGVTINSVSGVISGTPSVAATFANVVIRATDTLGVYIDSNTVDFVVALGESASTWAASPQTGVWTLSAADRTATVSSGTGIRSVLGSLGRSSGKRYAELVFVSGGSFDTTVRHDLGITRLSPPTTGESGVNDGIGYRRGGAIFDDAVNILAATALSAADVVMIAVDFTAGKCWIGRNGTWLASGNPGAGTGETSASIAAGTYTLFASSESGAAMVVTMNSKLAEMTYSPPSGFSTWAQT